MGEKNSIKIVVFEGCDGSGKTTLMRAFNIATNYKHLCIDRFTGSMFTYAYDKSRSVAVSEILNAENILNDCFDTYLILCNCEPVTINARLDAKMDSLDRSKVRYHIFLFNTYFELSNFNNKKSINTDNSLIKCVNEVVNFVEGKK